MSKAKHWFERAAKEKFAIGAFNAGSLETLKAVVGAAKRLQAPVMIEASHGEVEYFGIKELVGVVRTLEQSNDVTILLNLDHAPTFEDCKQAIEAGFDYVHFDGSKLPVEENIAICKEVVALAHGKEILVEGEMDHIEGSSADHRNDVDGYRTQMSDFSKYSDPVTAKSFIERTGVDTFASFVGNVHGLYPGPKRINVDLLAKIKQMLPNTFLSLHGGSGIPGEDIQAAINLGVVKININSELRVAFRDKLREVLQRKEDSEVAIYKIMPEAISVVQMIVEEKIRLFGSIGRNS
jgi:fructose-bisphosphate aldolase class II